MSHLKTCSGVKSRILSEAFCGTAVRGTEPVGSGTLPIADAGVGGDPTAELAPPVTITAGILLCIPTLRVGNATEATTLGASPAPPRWRALGWRIPAAEAGLAAGALAKAVLGGPRLC